MCLFKGREKCIIRERGNVKVGEEEKKYIGKFMLRERMKMLDLKWRK